MLTRFFDRITRASVAWRWVTILLTFVVLAIGGYSYTQINQELVPPVEFPQTILVAQWPDAESTEQFLTEVTQPLEEAVRAVEGVVNVESTTNQSLVFLIVRNEFGENQTELAQLIQDAANSVALPEGVEPEAISFSLSDLPVVVASVSSAELTLPELKALIETELEPNLAAIDLVSQVNISGGQELPEAVMMDDADDAADDTEVMADDTVTETAEVEPVEDAEPEITVVQDEELSPLSTVLKAGLRAYDINVEYAEDITPFGARGMIYQGGELAIQALRLLSDDNLRNGNPATLAYMPADFVETLDEELVEELQAISAEFGGVAQFTIAEAIEARDADLDVLTGRPIEDGTIADFPPGSDMAEEMVAEDTTATDADAEEASVEAVAETDEETVAAGVALPDAWIDGAAAQGLTLATTADLTPEFVATLATLAPQSLELLTPEMVLAMSPDVVAALPEAFLATLDDETLAQLELPETDSSEAASADVEAATENAVALPDAWVQGAATQGFTIETTADLTPAFVAQIAELAPQSLGLLTPEMVLAMSPDVVAVLPDTFLATLDEDTLAQLQPAATADAAAAAEPVDLPESWVGAASIQGLDIATTADVTPELIGGIATLAPQLLDDLTPDMLLAMSPENLAALPQDYLVGLDADVQAQLLALLNGGDSAEISAIPLPEDWITLAASRDIAVATTDDLTAELLRGVAIFAPSRIEQLTEEMLLAAPADALLGLPVSYLATLSDAVQTRAAEAATAMTAPDGATASMAEPVALPQEWIALAEQQGLPLETTADLTPEIVGGIAQFAPEALALLTPDMLLSLSPDVIGVLPADFVDGLDAELQDALLLAGEATDSASMDAEASDEASTAVEATEATIETVEEPDPALLSSVFATVGEQVGAELMTVDDIEPDFVRQLSAFGEQGLQLLDLLTPDNLRLMNPEAVALLPMEFVDGLDPDLAIYLDGLAVEYGGAGQLAITEAEEAAALSADAPALTGIWIEPTPEGEPSQFQTAADILNNPFAPSGADLLNFFPNSPNVENPLDWMGALDLTAITFMAENEATFVDTLQTNIVEMLPSESILYLIDTYPDAYDAETADRLRGVATGDVEVFLPDATITRANGNPSLLLQVFKKSESNTVSTFHEVDEIMAAFSAENDIDYLYAFEQSTFIEESIEGVTREGVLGALFAVIVILIFLSGRIQGKFRLSWRATLITGLSIPASVLFALLLMWIVPNTIGPWLRDLSLGSDNVLLTSIAKLFPAKLTLNIMTLSGLTVAIGRVVDDSIVVLENSYRYIQKGESPAQAVFRGTREVAVAIFSATVTTMAVFLPIGFVGGLISEFFLPFGLTVTYALAASYIVSITVVPALTVLLIRRENIPEERETAMQRGYTPILEWALKHRTSTLSRTANAGQVISDWFGRFFTDHRIWTLAIASIIFVGSAYLITTLPNSFIPGLGDPTINVRIEREGGTPMATTDAEVREFEALLSEFEGFETVLTEVGSAGGQEALLGGTGVNQNLAALTISIEEGEDIDALSAEVRELAQAQFGEDNVLVTAAVQAGFSGFALIVTGDSLDEIVAAAPDVQNALVTLDADEDGLPDLVNVGSNADAAVDGTTVIRIDGQPAVSFTADLQTADTIGVAQAGIAAIEDVLPSSLAVSEGFDSQQQSEGFQGMVSAIGVSIVLVYLIMALTFRSLVHPLTILFSLPFALVGAAIALFITQSVLGISAMMGLLMLVGVVVTNGIVLLEMVQQLREEGMDTYNALVEAGRTRIRPIWMTALTAILALIPLAASTEGGAIIAAELGTAVIGGLIVSTALTLVVIPVVYSIFDQITNHFNLWQYRRLSRRIGVSGD